MGTYSLLRWISFSVNESEAICKAIKKKAIFPPSPFLVAPPQQNGASYPVTIVRGLVDL